MGDENCPVNFQGRTNQGKKRRGVSFELPAEDGAKRARKLDADAGARPPSATTCAVALQSQGLEALVQLVPGPSGAGFQSRRLFVADGKLVVSGARTKYKAEDVIAITRGIPTAFMARAPPPASTLALVFGKRRAVCIQCQGEPERQAMLHGMLAALNVVPEEAEVAWWQMDACLDAFNKDSEGKLLRDFLASMLKKIDGRAAAPLQLEQEPAADNDGEDEPDGLMPLTPPGMATAERDAAELQPQMVLLPAPAAELVAASGEEGLQAELTANMSNAVEKPEDEEEFAAAAAAAASSSQPASPGEESGSDRSEVFAVEVASPPALSLEESPLPEADSPDVDPPLFAAAARNCGRDGAQSRQSADAAGRKVRDGGCVCQ
eukprot:TRINITY_DN3954_c0_g1_i1.p1 TRINITY_DN3954_c0_g1~~TRINITY_DN3954_c0_g1_i1.p1  ORF type:complete len:401 (+),score=112.63 TRINITY_DN3954_c0_g1_i1:70-1203(+)